MIFESTESHQFENDYFIQRAVGQRAAFAKDLNMYIHALHPKINARSIALLPFYIPQYGLLQISQALQLPCQLRKHLSTAIQIICQLRYYYELC